MVDLSAQPFNLDADAIAWVHESIESLTLEEKVGQLFINFNVSFTPGYLDNVIDNYHVGGVRFMGSDSATVQEHIRYGQDAGLHAVVAEGRVQPRRRQRGPAGWPFATTNNDRLLVSGRSASK